MKNKNNKLKIKDALFNFLLLLPFPKLGHHKLLLRRTIFFSYFFHPNLQTIIGYTYIVSKEKKCHHYMFEKKLVSLKIINKLTFLEARSCALARYIFTEVIFASVIIKSTFQTPNNLLLNKSRNRQPKMRGLSSSPQNFIAPVEFKTHIKPLKL